jgi:hypothetical protein
MAIQPARAEQRPEDNVTARYYYSDRRPTIWLDLRGLVIETPSARGFPYCGRYEHGSDPIWFATIAHAMLQRSPLIPNDPAFLDSQVRCHAGVAALPGLGGSGGAGAEVFADVVVVVAPCAGSAGTASR